MKPELTSTQVRERLKQLAADRRTPLAALSRMLQRSDRYLARFVREGTPERLEPHEIASLATFFGVEQWELGGYIMPRSKK